jgi:hypothetical protein
MEKSKGSVQRQKQELGRQKELGEPKWRDFKEETLQQGMYIKPMAVVQKGSPVVKILHSIVKFADADGPEELSGKIFGFYGERTKYEKNAWEWNKKAKFVTGAIGWKTCLGQAGNAKKLWARNAAAALETELPRMIQVPARVAIYAMEAPRTAVELYDFINEITMEEESELENTDTEFVKKWLVAAGQKDSGVALDLQTPATQDETFWEWAMHILQANLGPEEQAPVSPQEQGRR